MALSGLLNEKLTGARSYDRIAGYFSSSILEVAGEALDSMAPGSIVRVVCNSSLEPLDVATAHAAKQAMYREWCVQLPADVPPKMRRRLQRLYDFLASGRLQVRVLPDRHFGLIHGKAGVIVAGDGGRLCFLGSTNESKSAWELNYELVWTDDSAAGVVWVQEEFEALWKSPGAVELGDAVVKDIERQTRRVVVDTVEGWSADDRPDEAAPIVELPVYRRENGLWAHQKYFVKRAFAEHLAGGARLLLADQVGLGKTIQLALAAKLMALVGDKPILALAPKPLLKQWQEELWDLLALPSARWTGRQWVDENEIAHPEVGIEGLRRCPRRLGLVSTGLIIQAGAAADQLARMDYECVILDEAHRARRRNLGPAHEREAPDRNNLLRFLLAVAPRTKSLLLATATPVQVDPIEAFDLLDALNDARGSVLGSTYSQWHIDPRRGLAFVQGRDSAPSDEREIWEWMRDPLPPASEDLDFETVRRALDLADTEYWARPGDYDRLNSPNQSRIGRMGGELFANHNPYIRHIVRRTREYLEETLDPQTNEPYLKPVRVRLFGEQPDQAVVLPTYLQDAYAAAERFCEVLGQRPGLNSGFLKTILLRRVGSTIHAGQSTAAKMLGAAVDVEDDEDDEGAQEAAPPASSIYPLSPGERSELERFLSLLAAEEEDPKARAVRRILFDGTDGTDPWIDRGCIVFSQYFDSVYWLGGKLSELLGDEEVGVYAGASRSGVFRQGVFTRAQREDLKKAVGRGEMRLLLGTEAASEGLNLQRLGTLINLDLPWNPTRLEQRKGRIQRIGQVRDEIYVYNMRYRGSVEDRVHQLLSSRLEEIRDLFGQVPDTLEDVWVLVAMNQEEQAKQVIDAVPASHPFEMRYDKVEDVDWESCARVLDADAQLEALTKGW